MSPEPESPTEPDGLEPAATCYADDCVNPATMRVLVCRAHADAVRALEPHLRSANPKPGRS